MINTKSILQLNCKKINSDKIRVKNFFGVSIDSRDIFENYIFFAIKGENTDGHNYLVNAFQKGASVAVVNESWYSKNKDKFKKEIFFVVKDTVKALGELAKIHLKRFNVPVLFVGGSNGKTTTKDLIAAVLSKGYNVLKNEGNLNNHLGLPLTILKLESSHNFCVLEAGSNHFNEIKYLCSIGEPGYGLVTNIGREHLEFFKNLNGVAKEEFSLFDYLKRKDGLCFVNLDDKMIREYYIKNKIKKGFTYSYNFKSDVKAKFIKYTNNFEPVIELNYKNSNIIIEVNTFGKHSVYNALAAAAVGLYFGITPENIKLALENYIPISSKRMEIERKKDFIIINDAYNSNPDSVKLGLETLNELKTNGNIHLVIADMLELGKSSKKEHFEIGKLIKKMNFKNLYTFGKESKNIFSGAKGLKNNFHFEEKKDLSEFLINTIEKGDVIYFKGSRGMKLEEIVERISRYILKFKITYY